MIFPSHISRFKAVKYTFGQKIKLITPILIMNPGFTHIPTIGIAIIPITGKWYCSFAGKTSGE
jgi:CRISPR/Cas system CMR-associated protein Cmr3 (group 5 of RAMP superfamily)